MTLRTILSFALLTLLPVAAFGQIADGANQLQSELESFAGPASIAGVILGFAVGYFSDDGSIGKKIGYGMMFISIIAGAATFAGLFGA
ncbi:MAG: hypothetical protein QNK37_35250 [Acidobacteriota bacterium]|nr:hypothetical protein [Acidobacteriota bacterium]